MRVCNVCGEEKPLADFHKWARGEITLKCKACYRAVQRAKYLENIDVRRARNKLYDATRRYGITLEQRTAIFDRQAGRCALCRAQFGPEIACVDHDHNCCPGRGSCGRCVRGLLCRKCNTALGTLGLDFPDGIERVTSYLGRSS